MISRLLCYLLPTPWQYDPKRDCAGGEHGFYLGIKNPSVIRNSDGELVRVILCKWCEQRIGHDLRFRALWQGSESPHDPVDDGHLLAREYLWLAPLIAKVREGKLRWDATGIWLGYQDAAQNLAAAALIHIAALWLAVKLDWPITLEERKK